MRRPLTQTSWAPVRSRMFTPTDSSKRFRSCFVKKLSATRTQQRYHEVPFGEAAGAGPGTVAGCQSAARMQDTSRKDRSSARKGEKGRFKMSWRRKAVRVQRGGALGPMRACQNHGFKHFVTGDGAFPRRSREEDQGAAKPRRKVSPPEKATFAVQRFRCSPQDLGVLWRASGAEHRQMIAHGVSRGSHVRK